MVKGFPDPAGRVRLFLLPEVENYPGRQANVILTRVAKLRHQVVSLDKPQGQAGSDIHIQAASC